MTHRAVQLLGSAAARVDERYLPFSADQRYYLLAYLARVGDWVGRDRLAYLFWPDVPQKAARGYLRKLLFRTRALDWLWGLELNADKVRWRVDTDVAAFGRAIDERDWEVALDRYSGPFFAEANGEGSPAFADWLLLERERLAELWRDALFHHAAERAARGDYRRSCELLDQLLVQDELDEAALDAYMRASFWAGKRQQALDAYQEFAGRLHHELGLEPTADTQRLAHAVQANDREALAVPPATLPPREATEHSVGAAPNPTPAAVVLPTATTSFVGRERERQELLGLLARPDCRLVTVSGLGGVGKTRLALEVLREEADRSGREVAFVALEAVTDVAQVPTALADALGLAFEGNDAPLDQIARQLAGRRLTVLLDNLEQLVEGASFCTDLLRWCPELKLLVTSRERLGVEGEWLFTLAGLGRGEDAPALFVERVLRVRPDFVLDDATTPAVLRICDLVDGSPLGLELAAVWVRMLSCREIADEIERNLDFLATEQRTFGTRHRSLRATFDHSWALLTPGEQAVLRDVSVFRDGFDRTAAKLVVGAPLAVLASLVDKSLLRTGTPGRYDRHPLIYQYCQEKLAASRSETEVRGRHLRYFHRVLGECGELVEAGRSREARRRIASDLENIKLALSTAVESGDARAVRDGSTVLTAFFESMSRFRDGAALFEALSDRLARSATWSNEDEVTREALGQILTARAAFSYALRDFERATRLASEALERLKPLQGRRGSIHPLTLLGAAALEQGDYPTAKAYLERALQLVRKVHPHGLATSLGNLAVIEDILGNYPVAERLYREAYQRARTHGNGGALVMNLNNFGRFLLNTGNLQRARALFEEGLAAARAQGTAQQVPPLLSHLALVGYWLHDDERADAYAHEAREEARRLDQPSIETEALVTLGRLALRRNDPVAAETHLREALEIVRPIGQVRMLLYVLIAVAELRIAQGDPAGAAACLRAVCRHPAVERVDREHAEGLLSDLGVAAGTASVPADHDAADHDTTELDAMVNDFMLPT